MVHTLLPYDDFKLTALVLTDQLLKQQMKDCVVLLNTLHEIEDVEKVNPRDPTVLAWTSCELQLCEFGLTCYETFIKRSAWPVTAGVNESYVSLENHFDLAGDGDLALPKWFGQDWVHLEYQGLMAYLWPDPYAKMFSLVAPCSPENFRYPKAA